ncbi:hypothetical protein DRN86_05170, partial [Candidatus Geothermarchaeota archaeon]
MSSSIVDLARKALANEIFSYGIYSRLAELYREGPLRSKLRRIAKMEEKHANFWIDFLKNRLHEKPQMKINRLKLALYTITFRILGVGLTLRMLELGEKDTVGLY